MSEEKICKNCGKQISEDFKLCPYCGEKVEEEILEILCPYCGKTIKSDFKVCPYCGNNYNNKKIENYYSNSNEMSDKNGIVCLLLLLFLGEFGAHKFYAGRIAGGVVMLVLTLTFLVFADMLGIHKFYVGRTSVMLVLTLGAIASFVLWIIDLIQLVSGNFKDAEGKYLKTK